MPFVFMEYVIIPLSSANKNESKKVFKAFIFLFRVLILQFVIMFKDFRSKGKKNCPLFVLSVNIFERRVSNV